MIHLQNSSKFQNKQVQSKNLTISKNTKNTDGQVNKYQCQTIPKKYWMAIQQIIREIIRIIIKAIMTIIMRESIKTIMKESMREV